MKELNLTVVTPGVSHGPLLCDSVHVTVPDNADGQGGGSYGIRPGHIQALIALAPGPLTAFADGRPLFSVHCGPGFATVEGNTVTVVTEECHEINA